MTALPTITRRRMDANDRDYPPYDDDILALIHRHGIDPNGHDGGEYVVWVEYDVFDTALLRFGIAAQNEDGVPLLVCERDGRHCHWKPGPPLGDDCGEIAIEPVERALIGDLPAWWQPEATP